MCVLKRMNLKTSFSLTINPCANHTLNLKIAVLGCLIKYPENLNMEKNIVGHGKQYTCPLLCHVIVIYRVIYLVVESARMSGAASLYPWYVNLA